MLGLGLNRSGQAAEAERVWERALAIDAHHPETLEQLAMLYTSRNRLAEAAVLADRLSRQPGWELRGELTLGSLRSELNDPAGAAKVLRQALGRPEASRISSERASSIASSWREFSCKSQSRRGSRFTQKAPRSWTR